jgi:peroxiredoxin
MAQPDLPNRESGWKAADFALPATDGRTYRILDCARPKGLVVAFICNHCPYVKASIDRFVADAAELKRLGIGAVAICSNDAVAYPDDSFDKMKAFAARHSFPFPYLHDETQEAARSYGAVCTPDYFGFDGELVATEATGHRTKLLLTGTYDVPLGILGRFGDGLMGHRIARRSVADFLRDVAHNLDRAVMSQADRSHFIAPIYPEDMRGPRRACFGHD